MFCRFFSPLSPFLGLCESSYWGIPPLAFFYWGNPPQSFTFGASPHCHSRFGASPHCHFRLGHPPTVIYVWGIPPQSFLLGHPPIVISFRASPYFHLVQGFPLPSVCLGHLPFVLDLSLPQVFTYGPSSLVFRVSFFVWLTELLFFSVQHLELAFWFGFQSYYFLGLAVKVSFLVWLPEPLFFQFSVQSQLFDLASRAIIFSVSVFRAILVVFLASAFRAITSQYQRLEPILGDIFRFG